MCDYCSVGTEWIVYMTNRTNGIMVCTTHLAKAIKAKHELSNSTEIIHSEPVYT